MRKAENFQFETGTGSDASCSFVQNGIMYIVGGYSENYNSQISIVENCRLNRVGELFYDFRYG